MEPIPQQQSPVSIRKAEINPYVKINLKEKKSEEFNQLERARFLATAEFESGMLLQVIPVSSLGTQLDADTLPVGVALTIGAPVCKPHI